MNPFYFGPASDPLSWEEMNMVPYFIKALERHVEVENAILMRQIHYNAQMWKKVMRITTPLSRIRITRIIRYIRLTHALPCLCAGKTGFFVTRKPEVLSMYIDKLNSRAAAIYRVSDEMKNDLLMKLRTG